MGCLDENIEPLRQILDLAGPAGERRAMLISGFRSALANERTAFIYPSTGAAPKLLRSPFLSPCANLSGQ